MVQEQSLQLQIKSLWRSNMKDGGGGGGGGGVELLMRKNKNFG